MALQSTYQFLVCNWDLNHNILVGLSKLKRYLVTNLSSWLIWLIILTLLTHLQWRKTLIASGNALRAVCSNVAFFFLIESNQIHLNQIDFSRERPLSAKHIFTLSPFAPFCPKSCTCIWRTARMLAGSKVLEHDSTSSMIHLLPNFNSGRFTPLSLLEPLFLLPPFCPLLPHVPQLFPELIYANICCLAGAKTSRVGSSAVITSSVCVCLCNCVCVCEGGRCLGDPNRHCLI